MDSSPLGSPVPGILQERTLEWVAISFSNAWKWKVKVKSLSRVQLFANPWTTTYQAPPSLGVSRQEYWSGVPLPSLCPLSPGICSHSCPFSHWCHSAVSFSAVPFSSCLQSFPASGCFPELALRIRWPKYWSFSFSISPSNEYSGSISFRIEWFDLLVVQWALKSLL